MAIPNYSRPQHTIAQLLATLPDATADRLAALALGPQYLLNRYGEETTPGDEFLVAGDTLSYRYTDSNGAAQALSALHTVDLTSVKLYGENLEAELANLPSGGTNPVKIESLTAPNVLRIDNVNFAGGTIEPLLKGRDTAVGDKVYCDDGNRVVKRTIIGLRGKPVAATYGSDADGTKDDTHARNSSYNPATLASPSPDYYSVSIPSGWAWQSVDVAAVSYNVSGSSVLSTAQGLVNAEEYTITVQQGGTAASGTVRVNISSKSGLYTATNYAPTDAGGGGGTAGDFRFSDAALAGSVIDIRGPGGAAASMVAGQVFKVQVLAPYAQLDNTQIDGSDTGSGYTGTKNTTYLIKVKTGTTGDTATGAVLEISDTAGVDEVSEVTVTNGAAFDVGTYGLQATFDVTALGAGDVVQAGLRAGDTYYIHAVAASESTTEFNGAVLDGPAADTSLFTDPSVALDVRIRLDYTGQITSDMAADGTAWTANAGDFTLDANVAMEIPERDTAPGDEWVPFVDSTNAVPPATTGMVYLSYRAAVPAPEIEDKILIETVSDITEKLGTIALENDLAFGANEMLNGANGKSIYALRTAGAETADFTAALKKIESTDSIYSIGVIADDIAVGQAVASHCESMSQEDVKNFRRCYIGSDSPGSYAVLKPASGDPNYTATVSDYNGQGNLLVTTADAVDFRLLGLAKGDRFLLTGVSSAEYEISSVLSATEILLAAGPASPISPAEPFELWRADTADSQADYIIERSKALKSRRAVNVWCENGTRLVNGASKVIPNKYAACEIAGLRTAILPQQGLSMTEIQSVTDCPSMYVRYTHSDLDRVASNGTFIITQEAESGEVFIRHQLTTETEGGDLYYEDSAGVNIDHLSFLVKDALRGFVGKKNVTQDTVDEIYDVLWGIGNDASQTDRASDYGPQINGFEDPAVEIDPVYKDTINTLLEVEIPLPLNHLKTTIYGTVSFEA